MADREIPAGVNSRIAFILLLGLLLASLFGHYLADAFLPSPNVMSSTMLSASRASGASRASVLLAHPLHYALTWAGELGLGMLLGLTFRLAIPARSNALLSFPPPSRPPVITALIS